MLNTNTDLENKTLNTDEDSLIVKPLRSDLETGMSADVSGGVTSGPHFGGNLDSDSDAGLATKTTHNYTKPSAMNETAPVSATVTTTTPPSPPLDKAVAAVTDKLADAKDAAAHAAGDVKAQAGQAVDQIKEQAGHLADQAKTQVTQLTAQATDKVKEQLDSQKGKAADSLTAITTAIKQSADTLNQQGQAPIASAVTGIASQVENFAGYLQNKSVDEIAGEVTAYAKKNPQVFIGGAFLLGIALARFLKSSGRTASASVSAPAQTTSTTTYSMPSATPGYGSYGTTTIAPYNTAVNTTLSQGV